MSSRSFALTAAVLLVVGFGSGYLMGSPKTYSQTVKGLLVQDGPMIHLENREGKDSYLIVMAPKSASRPPVVVAKERSVEIRKDTLQWLGVYRLERAAYLGIDDIVKPCIGGSCTPGTPLPPPPPPPMFQILTGGEIRSLPQSTLVPRQMQQ